MTHELVLTSVSQGLEPDSPGFGSVAESGTLSPQLVMRLKSISDYRHLYAPDTDDAVHNPIAYSHLIVPTHESVIHVLSRVADSGIDFQHEPNRLAHHVVLDTEERSPEGPAWILAQSGFHVSQWLTPSVRFVQGRPLPTLTAPPSLSRLRQIDRERQRLDAKRMDPFVGAPPSEVTELPPLGNTPCPFWELLTGDAGWGGVLAATIRSGRPAVVVFRPGTNVLPLFVESLALIPSSMRWKATFSTYFTQYPEHVVCQWKAVPVDSPEVRHLREDPTVLLIDLTASLGAAPEGPYVEFARNGAEHSLPENENQADLFEDVPDLFDNLSVPLEIPTTPLTDEPSVTPEQVEPDESVVPPVVAPPPIRIRTSSQKTSNAVGSFLNMKSRKNFYAIFGVTLLCVAMLLVVVLDQIFRFGILTNPPAKPNTASTAKGGKPKAVPQKGEEEPQPDPAAIAAERQRKAEEAKRKKDEERKRLEQQQREDAEKSRLMRTQAQADAEDFLDGFPTLKNLTLDLPDADHPPVAIRPFEEFASLYPFGAVLHFQVVPLVRDPRLEIVTTPTHSPEESALPLDAEVEEPVAAVVSASPSRFEWSVDGVYPNGERIPFLLLTLMEDGLIVDWQKGAHLPQSSDVAALLRFGFLRFGVEGVTDPSRIHSVPLFETEITDPVYPARMFTDSATFDIPTPLADEPYKSIFENDGVSYSLRLDVVCPEKLPGVNKIDFPETGSPAHFHVEMETETKFKKPNDSGNDGFQWDPITLSFQADAEAGQIRWSDRYTDQLEMFDKERKENKARSDDIAQELDKILKGNLGGSGILPPELTKRRDDLKAERLELDRRNKEIEDILSKLPDVHDRIVGNEEFRFEYSLFLVPQTDEKNSEPPLLRREESVPLMKTSSY